MTAMYSQATFAQPQIITLLDDSEIDNINGGMSKSDAEFYLGVVIGIAIALL